ncbi:hypothetical protein F8388_017946 [Cannabis sativa]|uniref:Uncharacterized protein n=1 Tax=Cannabis sativa TaxID=3483 RepID=A0A7J6E5A4_CANSA|nr:hypothetical protein F8388_017946 [Cannabis sativa]
MVGERNNTGRANVGRMTGDDGLVVASSSDRRFLTVLGLTRAWFWQLHFEGDAVKVRHGWWISGLVVAGRLRLGVRWAKGILIWGRDYCGNCLESSYRLGVRWAKGI